MPRVGKPDEDIISDLSSASSDEDFDTDAAVKIDLIEYFVFN